MTESFAARVGGIAALAEPARRALYEYVVAQPEAVTRDEVTAATGMARHNVKFHLDRLVADGLLTVEYRRPAGRSGPGAGRPAKYYRRVDQEVSVSLPPRAYQLVGEILAAAVDAAAHGGEPVSEAVTREAYAAGHRLARAVGAEEASADRLARTARGGEVSPDRLASPAVAGTTYEHDGAEAAPDSLRPAVRMLAATGYEPRVEADRVVMVNCPFHALSQTHTELVCGLNRALVAGLADELGLPDRVAVLDPAPGRCCVTLVPD